MQSLSKDPETAPEDHVFYPHLARLPIGHKRLFLRLQLLYNG